MNTKPIVSVTYLYHPELSKKPFTVLCSGTYDEQKAAHALAWSHKDPFCETTYGTLYFGVIAVLVVEYEIDAELVRDDYNGPGTLGSHYADNMRAVDVRPKIFVGSQRHMHLSMYFDSWLKRYPTYLLGRTILASFDVCYVRSANLTVNF